MAIQGDTAQGNTVSDDRPGSRRRIVVRAVSAALGSLGQLVGGFGTALLALFVLAWLVVAALTCLIGVGFLMAPTALRALHALARHERDRLGRHGPEIVAPDPPPTALREALTDATTHRELRWLLQHVTLGLLLGFAGLLLPIFAVRDLTFPLWWQADPGPGSPTLTSVGIGTAYSWLDAFAASLLGVGWVSVILGLTPGMARLQAWPGRRFLAAGPDTDLSLRIAELTATRAAALDAHATELRRIERSLHDGTQNRLVSVTVLADRGLAGALSGLAANCAVPCRTDVDAPERCAASVEATAYFVVAEALTNIAKHSGATQAAVTVRGRGRRLFLRIEDDGRGGADENGGSGLAGIRRRVAAHDGTLSVASPPDGPTTIEVELPCGL